MPTPDLPKVEAAIIELTNTFRQEQGLAVVRSNAVLRRAAEEFAKHLARTGTFSHTADGRQPAQRAKAAGYDYCLVAENLASNLDSRGFETRQLARDAVEGWKNSPGHRKNLVQPHLTEIAVAVAKAPGQEKYLSVQMFGRPAALRYDVSVRNTSEVAVSYTLGARDFTIEGRRVVTHTECTPANLSFVSAGSWLSKQSLSASFPVASHGTYLIEPDAQGKGLTIVKQSTAAPQAVPAAAPQKAAAPAGATSGAGKK